MVQYAQSPVTRDWAPQPVMGLLDATTNVQAAEDALNYTIGEANRRIAHFKLFRGKINPTNLEQYDSYITEYEQYVKEIDNTIAMIKAQNYIGPRLVSEYKKINNALLKYTELQENKLSTFLNRNRTK